MSMNVSSIGAANPAGFSGDKITGSGAQSAQDSVPNSEHISTPVALQKASLSGEKIAPGEEQLVKKLDKILKAIQGPNTSFEMSVHKQTNTVVIKVLNKDTGELIREIPPEKTLDLVAKFMEINGVLIDEKV